MTIYLSNRRRPATRRLVVMLGVSVALTTLMPACSDSDGTRALDDDAGAAPAQIVDLLQQNDGLETNPFAGGFDSPDTQPDTVPPDSEPDSSDPLRALFGDVSIQHQDFENATFFTLDFTLTPTAVIADDAGERYAIHTAPDGVTVTCGHAAILEPDDFYLCFTVYTDGEVLYDFFELRGGTGLGVFVLCAEETGVEACAESLIEDPDGAVVVSVTEARSSGPATAVTLTGTDAGELIGKRQYFGALPDRTHPDTSFEARLPARAAAALRSAVKRGLPGLDR